MLPEHGHLNRGYYLGKFLCELGHETVVFAGSHPHNTHIQLLEGNEKYKVYQNKPFQWVLIRTRNYEGSKISRVFSMFEFYFNLKKAVKHFQKPDVVIGSSAHPLAALLAIQLGNRYGCKKIIEVRDLWPESIVAYGVAKDRNPVIIAMRMLEKWLYSHADKVFFLMGGGYDYICDQGWDKEIPKNKIVQISNGIDLQLFSANKNKFTLEDEDLENKITFKIVYTGSLRKADEQILGLFEVIDLMQGVRYSNYQFLLYGDGNLKEELEHTCKIKGYKNVRLKGFIDKRYIPFVLSKCNLAILNIKPNSVLKYGGSQNKLFDYLAAGLPIISGEDNKYSVVNKYGCGVSKKFTSANEIVEMIEFMKNNPVNSDYIKSIAEKFDYSVIAKKIIDSVS